LLDVAVLTSDVRRVIRSANQPLVERADPREDYRGEKVPAGKKSMLWSFSYRSAERTLTDVEVDAAHEAIVAAVITQLGAARR
jgi:phenylalanyl-tRNA synthetase beta chain